MKITLAPRKKYSAFTLIEMIGVLAVIAILASLLIPKILNAINDAKVNNTVLSYNTIKTATMEHYAKYGGFGVSTNGVAFSSTYSNDFASQLLVEGLVDKPLSTKVGTSSLVKIVLGSATMSATQAGAYDLDGNGTSDTGAAGVSVAEVQITGVSASDAKDISDRIDGTLAPFATTFGATDTIGRVKWDSGTQLLSIYIGHR